MLAICKRVADSVRNITVNKNSTVKETETVA